MSLKCSMICCGFVWKGEKLPSKNLPNLQICGFFLHGDFSLYSGRKKVKGCQAKVWKKQFGMFSYGDLSPHHGKTRQKAKHNTKLRPFCMASFCILALKKDNTTWHKSATIIHGFWFVKMILWKGCKCCYNQ